jgi:peptidoglycan hydrolase-like protein with peptidoglycan-binding domain
VELAAATRHNPAGMEPIPGEGKDMRLPILLLTAAMAAAACQTAPPEPAVTAPAAFGVRDIQAGLKDLGYYQGAVDGIAGPVTRRAVTRSQTDFGLPATGEIDGPLYARIEQHLRKNPPHPDLPRAAQVFALQRALARLGYYDGPVDGRYVGETLKAYLVYQRQNGLPITHKVDARTLRRIEREAAAAPVSG